MKRLDQAKALYRQGKSVSEIAAALQISRTAVYAYKTRDLACGVDWDNLRFIKATDGSDAQGREQDFVALLIFRFEAALEKINTLGPEQQLKELTQYANTYYKLKLQRDNPKVSKAEVAKQVLHQLSHIALQQSAHNVIAFLSDNAEAIITAVVD